jgi:hypothetical protein
MARSHGTSGYAGGCRCKICRAANTERQRRRREAVDRTIVVRLELDPNLWAKAENEALSRGSSVEEVASQALHAYLDRTRIDSLLAPVDPDVDPDRQHQSALEIMRLEVLSRARDQLDELVVSAFDARGRVQLLDEHLKWAARRWPRETPKMQRYRMRQLVLARRQR